MEVRKCIITSGNRPISTDATANASSGMVMVSGASLTFLHAGLDRAEEDADSGPERIDRGQKSCQ